MSDLLATVLSNVKLPGLIPISSPRSGPVAVAGAAPGVLDFGAALGELLTPGASAEAKGGRQPDADNGKELPAKDEENDPPIAWLPEGMVPPSVPLAQPVPSPLQFPTPDEEAAATASLTLPVQSDETATDAARPTLPLPSDGTVAARVGPTLPVTPDGAADATVALTLPVPPDVAATASEGLRLPVPLDGTAGTRVGLTPPAPSDGVSAAIGSPVLSPIPADSLPVVGARAPDAALTPVTMPRERTPVGSVALKPGLPLSAAYSIMVEARDSTAHEQPTEPRIEIVADRGRFEPASRDGARPLAPPLVTLAAPTVQVAITSGAAAQVFAAALIPNPAEPMMQSDRVSEAALQLQGQARSEQLTTVQAMSGGAQAALDMTRDDWTGQMIERIAVLRESAEAADTRIKLAPENLGALEISIRRDGDRIHVHFTAENAAARQMIADAAPRLADLADARGVKLGQTSVDGGSQHGGQRDPDRPQSQSSARNTSVASPGEPVDDQRIA